MKTIIDVKYWLMLVVVILVLVAGFYIFGLRSNENNSKTNEVKIIPSLIIAPTASKTPENKLPENYEVPILMYHYIRVAPAGDDLGYALSVTPENFDLQVKWLQENNYASMTLADLADPQKIALRKIFAQNKKPIILTFDDGYEDAYTAALPVLKKYQFVATFFIIENKTDKDGLYLTSKQILEMETLNMEIGSHTLTHPNLATSSSEKMRKEILESKKDTLTFCYPSGRYNENVENTVKEAGYLAAVTTEFGVAKNTSNLFALKRVRVENGDGIYLGERIEKARKMSAND